MSTPPAPRSGPRFGVNYTPRRGWFHSWYDFDPALAREDLDQIAGLDLDHVRIFPLWPLLQPNRTLIRASAVDQVAQLVDVAADAGLDVMVDGVQGHLSSFDFYPEWTRSWHHRNVFTDPEAIEAQANLLRALGAALAGRPNLLGLQLGNELNNLVEHNPVTVADIDHYLDTLLAAARTGLGPAGAAGLVTHSAYDAAWYSDDHPFTPEASARKGDLTTVHPWVFSADCARRYGPRSPQVQHLAEYGVELATAYAEDPARPVWVQETGRGFPNRTSRRPTPPTSPARPYATPSTAPTCTGSPGGAPTTSTVPSPTSPNWSTPSACSTQRAAPNPSPRLSRRRSPDLPPPPTSYGRAPYDRPGPGLHTREPFDLRPWRRVLRGVDATAGGGCAPGGGAGGTGRGREVLGGTGDQGGRPGPLMRPGL